MLIFYLHAHSKAGGYRLCCIFIVNWPLLNTRVLEGCLWRFEKLVLRRPLEMNDFSLFCLCLCVPLLLSLYVFLSIHLPPSPLSLSLSPSLPSPHPDPVVLLYIPFCFNSINTEILQIFKVGLNWERELFLAS